MQLRLKDHVYWCAPAGRVIFLDAEADRYFGLPAAAEEAFLHLAAGREQQQDQSVLAPLIARGMLVEDQKGEGVRPPHTVELATEDLLREDARTDPIALAEAFFFELSAAWLLRTRPLVELIERAAEILPGAKRNELDLGRTLSRIAAASVALSLVTRATNRCLVRALAVHRACQRRRIAARLVFGVRINPFGAHCWVQHQERVLVGEFEQVRLYTPILALG
jgi:hypothetical protein